MPPARLPLVLLAAAVMFVGGACSWSQTITTDDAGGADEPLPTIGLGSEIDDGFGPDDAGDGLASGDIVTSGDGVASGDGVDTVVMIGDSITVGSLPALEDRFEMLGLDRVVIEAENGKRIAQEVTGNPSGVTIADSLTTSGVAANPDRELWVVALGTNDVGKYADESDVAAVVDSMLAAVPTDVPLVWVDAYLPFDPAGTELVNEVVRDRLEARGDAVIAEWSEVADRDGVLSGDLVHPTDEGNEVFAATVVSTVARALEG